MLALLRRPANLYLLLTYLALSAVPFAPFLLGKTVERPLQVLGIECVAWMAVWAVFKRPAYFHWLLVPAFLALPTELYLVTYYGQGISTHHLGIIAETSPTEAMEFLGNTVWLMGAVMLASLAWLVSSWRAAVLTRDLDWADASRWVAVAALALGAGVWAYGYEFGIEGRQAAGAQPASAAGTGAQPAAGAQAPAPATAPPPVSRQGMDALERPASDGFAEQLHGSAGAPTSAQQRASASIATNSQPRSASMAATSQPQASSPHVAATSLPRSASTAATPHPQAGSRPIAASSLPRSASIVATSQAQTNTSIAATSQPQASASLTAAAPAKNPAKPAKVRPEDRPVAAANLTGWKLPALPHAARLPIEFDAFANSWPFGLAGRGRAFYKERQYLAELGARNSKFTFGARQVPADPQPEIVVMVIGESSRADRWSLNGYARETNPLLSKEANLIFLPDVITSVSATRLSVPVMISRKPVTQSLKNGFSEKSFVTAYKEAGFKTFWLSNQVSFGEFDTPVSVFAKEADVVQFLNLGGFTNRSNFDEILLGPLHSAIVDKAAKKLIVLHTLGSHWNYSQRHPQQFDKWKPSLFGIDKPVVTDVKIKLALNNSYDSTILYTDWFLAKVIDSLKRTEQRSAMVYMADHGQSLYDGTCDLAFHGHNTEYDFHVPALVWVSDAYQAARPDKVALLRKHRVARLSTENAFHTLLDLANIRYPDERLAWSIASTQFSEHTRLVDSYGWSHYDNATRKGDCREIIDNGTPLKRER